MVRRDDTPRAPPLEQALQGALRETDPPIDEMGANFPQNWPIEIPIAEVLVGDVSLVSTHLVRVDIVTDAWVFETEIMIEYSRRHERQLALSRLRRRLQRLVHPELVSQVRIIHERRRVRAEFQVSLAPEIFHEAALRAMERSIRNRQRVPASLRPPVLERQHAQEIVMMNGRNPRDSQIGSSHGEISESDDLASAMNAFHARQRRSANTNRHRATPGARRNPTSFGPIAPLPPPPDGEDRAPQPTVTRYIVRSEIENALYTADNKFHFSGEANGECVLMLIPSCPVPLSMCWREVMGGTR